MIRAKASLLYLFAGLSGAAALGYQIVWAKQLSLAFGGTSLAVAAVVGAFLGGMGAGAALYHRLLAEDRSPLRLYGLLELGIGISGLLLTLGLRAFPAVVAGLPVEGAALVAARFGLAFALLLVPAALMGATFPALSVALIRSREGVARHLGALYGLNTLGAALGALVAGLVLVEALGLTGTATVSAILNGAVGLAALAAARAGGAAAAPAGGSASPGETALPTTLPAGVTGAVLALSGFATLAYEILWFRALGYLFGNSTYAFTIMLFVFLLGLGAGPLLFRLLAKRAPERALALCQLGIGVLAIVAVGVIARTVTDPGLAEHVSIFRKVVFDRPWTDRLLRDAVFALVTLLPATLLMGLSFPLASALWLGDVRQLGRRLGRAVLLANGGSIAGSVAAALWILPAAGTVGGTRLVAALNVALGVTALAAWRAGGRARFGPAVGAVGLAVLAVVALPNRIEFRGAGAAVPGAELVFEEEGDLATVQVWRDPARPDRLGMAIDGTIIGATQAWPSIVGAKQLLIAHLPMSLGAKGDALTIGLGSASTVEALARWEELTRIDVVEINEPVVGAAHLFPESASLADPRVRVHVDDALHYLLRADRTWDVIVSDGKQAMSYSGTAKLLSKELYELSRQRLADDGLFVQWIPLAVGAEEFRIAVRTMASVYSEIEVFCDPPSHLVFVAAKGPLDPSRFRESLPPAVQADLAALDVPSVEALHARWAASGDALLRLVGDGPRNTWDHPRLEFTAYKLGPAQWRAAAAEILALLVRAGEERSPVGVVLAPEGRPAAEAARLVRLSAAVAAAGDRDRASVLALRAVAADPADPAARAWMERLRR